ncbi:hypothetical protein JTE90_014315 [Oedothorax gibbosus]|uniref:HMG box domain-containing protein n=1 Tax=Oedothorax gibbosus TaxID=931172 RepID=A0AAV6UUT3_9ARAC|nr:hypothetical protein JTE90_014315 [Oedothorax gibbosus]
MAALMRFMSSCEHIVLKNCSLALAKNLTGEYAFSVKKVDIPAPPKRPLTAYMIFCKENRLNILKEDPTLSSTDQIKRLAVKWSELNNDMKKTYELSARQSTLVYGEAHKKFYESLTEVQKEELARLKEEKKESRRRLRLNRALQKSGIPKPAASAYTLFVKAEANKIKGDIHSPTEDNLPKTKWRLERVTEFLQSPMHMLGMSTDEAVPKRIVPTEFIKGIAEKWKKLTPEAKAQYEKEAVADKKRFESEMEKWKDQLIADGNKKLLKEFEETSRRKSKPKFSLQEK